MRGRIYSGQLTRRGAAPRWRRMLAAFAVFAVFAGGPLRAAAVAGPSRQEQQLLELVNQERQKAGLRQLRWSPELADAARAHSELLAQHEALSHRFRGEAALQQRAGKAGARFDKVAENVAYAPTVEKLHEGLMHSPPHRANILNPEYDAVGIAIVQNGGQLYATQDFARLLGSYSGAQAEDAVISAFNQARQTRRLPAMAVRRDPRLRKAACLKTLSAKKVLQRLPGATDLAIYTTADPKQLPANMLKAAADRTLHRMNLGVCFQPGTQNGFSRYWVVAAFYPVQ